MKTIVIVYSCHHPNTEKTARAMTDRLLNAKVPGLKSAADFTDKMLRRGYG
jgi:flavodoxin